MKIRKLISNERGLTLIEMLIAILIFILASVFIISLVTNALDKPKEAGIQNDFNHYEKSSTLTLKTSSNKLTDAELLEEVNLGTDKQAQFTNDESIKKNAYGNNYKISINRETPDQIAIVVDTFGKSKKKPYSLITVQQGKVVESCTNGFGRNDKELPTLVSPLCGDIVVVEDDTTAYTPVTVVPDGCTAITTDVQLDAIRNNLADCYIMMNDIDLTSSTFNTDADGWEPIGSIESGTKFTGIFYGNGYTINGLYINKPLGDYLGLFGMTDGAEFTNLTIANADVTGESLTAILAGQTDNTLVDNLKTSGSVETSDWLAAGLIANGWNNTTIKNSSSSVNATGMGTVAGLVGDFRNSDIQNSHTSGTITSTAQNTGGLVGYMSGGNISDSYAIGDITSPDMYSGGLVGYAQDVTINDSYSTGNVTGSDEIGGFIGSLITLDSDRNTVTDVYSTGSVTSSHTSRIGGLIGYMDKTDLTKATSSGHVIASGEGYNWDASGGLIGEVNESTLLNTHSTGNIDGEGFVGGLIGATYLDVTVSNSSSTGSVTNREAVNWDMAQSTGGFIGVVEENTLITNSFATGSVNGNLAGVDDAIAGFIGLNYGGDLEIANTYSTGVIVSSPVSSGFFGESLDGIVTITDSYYNSETSGKTDTGKGEPRTTAELKQQSTYTGFDFTTIWKIDGTNYPSLR